MFDIQLNEIPIFLSYLWAKKRLDLLVHLIILFILPTLPYIYISIKILYKSFDTQISYFGDGSIISLCIGIICAYFGRTHDYQNDGQKSKHRFFNVFAVILYITLLLFFIECQLTSPRSLCFIYGIVALSFIVLLFTVLGSLILTFDNYQDFMDYKDDLALAKAEETFENQKVTKSKIKI